MIENQVFGKLLPTNESILLILEEIRKKYQIPEISPSDDGMEILLRHELEFDWKAIHAEILEKIKKDPDLLTDKARTTYNAIKKCSLHHWKTQNLIKYQSNSNIIRKS